MPGAQKRNAAHQATQPSQKVSVKVNKAGIAVLAAILTAVVGFLLFRSVSEGATQTAPVSIVATAAGNAIAQEDFGSLDAWLFKASSGKDYRIALQNGEMILDVSGTALHNYFNGEFGAVTAEVDGRVLDGTDTVNSRFGLVFKKTNDAAYHFEYYPYQNGLWTLQLGQNDRFTSLAKGNAPGRAPTTFTKLRAEVKGNRVKLFVNGANVGEADVSAIAKGQIGVSATSDRGKTIRMAFDNFSIRE